MDTRSPSPVSQILVPSLSSTEDYSTGPNGQQKYFQPHFDTNVSPVTVTQQKNVNLTEEHHPGDDSKLGQTVLDRHPYPLPKPALELPPARMLARPASTGEDLNSGFSYQKPTMPAMNFSRAVPRKPNLQSKPNGDPPKDGT